jgi:RNA polymerase sigma-70 factor (ECF subfamily)
MTKDMVNDFEEHRDHLRAVAFRMLGSRSDADDAVQEAWLRMHRSEIDDVRNLRGWLTTVVARICLDVLRARGTRQEQSLDEAGPDFANTNPVDPEQEAVLADSVGAALLVVLQTLSPPERLALVLHDMFDVPFTDIGPIVGRSPNAAAQLASRARRRVRGQTPGPGADLVDQRRAVDAFMAAARDGNFDALVAVLHADVVLDVDAATTGAGQPLTIRGAHAVASNARMFADNARYAETALIDGAVGIVVAPEGQLELVLQFAVRDGAIAGIGILGDPDALRMLGISLLD